MPPELTDTDVELLSAYLDGMLPDSEKTALEQRLAQDVALRLELTALRQTIDLIRALPELKAPRSFTLTAEMVARPLPVDRETVSPAPEKAAAKVVPIAAARRRTWLPAVYAAAAVFVVAVGFVFVMNMMSSSPPAPAREGIAAMPTVVMTAAPFQNVPAGLSQAEATSPAQNAQDSPAAALTLKTQQKITGEAQVPSEALSPTLLADGMVIPPSQSTAGFSGEQPLSPASNESIAAGGGGTQGMGDDYATGVAAAPAAEVMQAAATPTQPAPETVAMSSTPVLTEEPADSAIVQQQALPTATLAEETAAPVIAMSAQSRSYTPLERFISVLWALLQQLAPWIPGTQP